MADAPVDNTTPQHNQQPTEALMKTISKVLLLTMTAALAACSEEATAPQATVEPSTPAYEGSMQDLLPGQVVQFSITIDPSRTTYYYLGAGNSLTFPAGSLCSIYSSYGQTEWDKPCNKAYSPITINVKAWLDAQGHARVDFDKHVRFVPSTDPAKWVVITFADMQAALDPFFNILYCPATTGACLDEAKLDPTLVTVRNPLTGKITRRIKHFSGYNVAAGRDVEGYAPSFSISPSDLELDSVDAISAAYPRMNAEDAASMLNRVREAKRSGYILASG
jgi:hypothetical protein